MVVKKKMVTGVTILLINEIGGGDIPTSPTRVTAARSVLCFHSIYSMLLQCYYTIAYLFVKFFKVPLAIKFLTRLGFNTYIERA